jgi:hypothetical protein
MRFPLNCVGACLNGLLPGYLLEFPRVCLRSDNLINIHAPCIRYCGALNAFSLLEKNHLESVRRFASTPVLTHDKT